MDITFETDASGSWQVIQTYTGVGDGTYTADTTGMDIKDNVYNWRVSVFDGSSSTDQTYSFTAKPFVLKWSYSTGAGTSIGPLAVDVDDDGIYEVFATGAGKITCLDGKTGELKWSYSYGGISTHSPYEIHDLNNDGIEEVVISAGGRTIALHANDGSVYWNVAAESAEKHLVIVDIEGNGYPYVYISSTDVFHWTDGTGRIRKLRGTDGAVLAETFAWRPCWGGLSAADPFNNGSFVIYMGDRSVYYDPPSLGKGMTAYDAENLELLWSEDGITCSSHCMAIVDVNNDGILDAVSVQQSGGGIYTIDGATGVKMPGKWSNSLGLTGHSQFSIYDIDGDGNLEMITCTGAPAKVWDMGTWSLDATLDSFGEPPKMADVIGDERLEIIGSGGSIPIYDHTYTKIETISGASSIASNIVQDIDNDGQNELIVISSGGTIRAYDTSAYVPTPRVRTNSLYYSERNMGAGVYVPPPGAPQPILKEVSPADGSTNIQINPTLRVNVIDYHYDLMDITISTDASGSWVDVATFTGVGNGWYEFTPTNMDQESTTYNWRVTAVDPDADNLTITKTYSFTTFTPPPFKPGWLYRKTIKIDHTLVEEDVTDFPVLIDITDADIGAKALANGDDLLFTSDDGETKLNHEIELYEVSSPAHLIAWVKSDLSSSEDTILYLYYGNAGASNQENIEGVWDSNFAIVQHLEETSGNHYDSTSNDNDATTINVITQGSATGQIDGADELGGSTSHKIIVPDSDSLDINDAITISAWIYPESWGGGDTGRIIDKTIDSAYGFFVWNSDGGKVSFYWYDGTATHQISSSGGSVSLDSWQHAVVTYDRSNVKFYINGVPKGIVARTEPIASNTEDLWIGNRESDGDRTYDGILDELRISNSIRSSGWVVTEYNNQNNPGSFYDLGVEETASGEPMVSNEYPENGAIDVPIDLIELSFDLFDGQGDAMDYYVTTKPYVGSGSETGVYDGTYTIPVSGLAMDATYTWYVNVTDGSEWTYKTFTFTTGFSLDAWKYRKKLTVNTQGEDNCRMYSVISNNLPDGLLQEDLIDAPSSLENLAPSNMDGWGIGYYTNYGDSATIERGKLAAHNDPNYDTVVGQIDTSEPKITLAHIRKCTGGCCDPYGQTIDNPHPFQRVKNGKQWTFMHNGGISVSLGKSLIGTEYLNENPLNCSGVCEENQNCDSEVYFLLLLKHIEENSWHAENGIVSALTELINAGETGGLNFVLSDGNTVWAFRRHQLSHHTLYYLYDDVQGYSAVASDYPSATQGSWIAMDDYDLVVLTSDSTPVVIDILEYNPETELENFPLLIDITDADLAAKAQEDGGDILFTDFALNKLDHEIELFDSATGHLVAWVNVPLLFCDQEKDIYIYYGNENVNNQENVEGVWDSDYMAVHHLQESSGTHYDSTLYSNDGTPENGVTQGVSGKINGADSFDGNDDHVAIADNATIDGVGAWTELTMETWVKSGTDNQATTNIFGKRDSSSSGSYQLGFDSAGNSQLFCGFYLDSYQETSYADSPILTTGEWYHLACTYKDGQGIKLYVNGELEATNPSASGAIHDTTSPLYLAARGNDGSPQRFMNGMIDEARISKIARNDGGCWFAMEYNNQNDPSAFIEVGEEEGTSDILVSNEDPENGAIGIGFNPVLSVDVEHQQSLLMNITFETDASGSWQVIQTYTDVGNGTYTALTTNVDQYSTLYHWKVNVDDGVEPVTKIYSFTTLSESNNPPTHDNPLLVSELGTNTIDEDLTCYNQSTDDANGDEVYNTYHWFKDGTSLTNLLLPFSINADDYSGYGNDGTVNGATWTSSGVVGGAYSFDGSGNYVSVTDDATIDGAGAWTELTMEAWVKSGTDNQATTNIFGKRDSSSSGSYQLGFDSAGNSQLFCGIYLASYQETSYADSPIMTTGEWYHLVCTYKDGEGIKLYVNGVLEATNPSASGAIHDTTGPLYLAARGNDGSPERFMNGMIDEARIYPIALTSEQVNQNYLQSKDGFSSEATIVSEETALDDEWKCEVTPSDLIDDGQTKLSNTLTIVEEVECETNEDCDDGLFCNGAEQCISNVCHAGTPIDCSTNDITGVAECFYSPDDVDYTLDYRAAFTSVCEEPGTCTIGNETITHECSVASCGADCDASNACTDTDCDYLDGCVDQDYYDYDDVANACLGDCTCTNNACGVPTIYTNDPRCSGQILVDNEFDDSIDSADLRTNSIEQDWYESRSGFSGGDPGLLTLDTSDIGGNSGKKAALKNDVGVETNAYMTQEFGSAQSGIFNLSFDIYIDSIEDNANYDRAAHIYIGDDRIGTNAPTGSSDERFVLMAFYDSTPGDTGDDLEIRARTASGEVWGTTSQWTSVATALSYDTWYGLKVVIDVVAGTYDVYVDDVLKGENIPKYAGYSSSSVELITFVSDSDGRGEFYVDNVFSPAQEGPVCETDADTDHDGKISMSELMAYIGRWKAGNVQMPMLMKAIGFWKAGVGC